MGFVSNPDKDPRLLGWSEKPEWHVVKMHTIAEWMVAEDARTSIRFFFSHRDLRDVVASAKRKFGWESVQVCRSIDAAISLQQRLQGLPEAQIHRYADLVAEPEKALDAIAEILGLTPSESIKADIISACSIDKAQQVQAAIRGIMSAKGMSIGEENKAPIFDQTTLLHHNHISPNGGKDGAWHHDLAADELQAINGRYEQWQQTEGYASSLFEDRQKNARS